MSPVNMNDPFDVVVIGTGVVGSAIARELAKCDLKCALIEASDDVGAGTSKANTAILHTGYDANPERFCLWNISLVECQVQLNWREH
jgi:glycerol-3-phosphate dehydrogenase